MLPLFQFESNYNNCYFTSLTRFTFGSFILTCRVNKYIYIYNNKSGNTVSKELNENSEHKIKLQKPFVAFVI